VRLTQAKAEAAGEVSVAHDRQKRRRLDPGRPFLQALGITDARRAVLPSMSHKWKQINRFLEVFDHVFKGSALEGRRGIHVVDFGAGKGYLTFAIHDYLRNTRGMEARVTGVELRPGLVEFCNEVAGRLTCEGLTFRQGSLADAEAMEMDVMIALHACDTATDLALHRGIRAGASILLCAPCCHKQIRPQMTAPAVLQPVLRHGVHLGQEAEMVTDSLRALLLESVGYQVGVFEFISLEHTDKNKMISAVKRGGAVDRGKALAQVEALKAFYGIREQELERLMGVTSEECQSP
jgi:SAM-dependent methyltransferase